MNPPAGAIDAIDILPLVSEDDNAEARVGDVLVVRGWAHQSGATPMFSLLIDDRSEHPIERGVPRPDVAAALDDSSAVESGFTVSVPTVDLKDGEHVVTIVVSAGGRRQEIARAQLRLSAPVGLANLPAAQGFLDSWTDEEGHSEPILGDSVRIPRRKVIRIDGWAADTVGDSAALAAFALIGDHVVEAAYGFERLDVAREFGEHHAYCGFSASFPGRYASPEGTPLRMVLLAADGSTLRPSQPEVTLVGYD